MFDQQRLWLRNLCRDDKIVSSNGKEIRYPFLSRSLQLWSEKIDKKYFLGFQLKAIKKDQMSPFQKAVWDISQLTEDHGKSTKDEYFYNKFIVRHLAYKCDLIKCSYLNKKAMQFGSGLSKKMNKGRL